VRKNSLPLRRGFGLVFKNIGRSSPAFIKRRRCETEMSPSIAHACARETSRAIGRDGFGLKSTVMTSGMGSIQNSYRNPLIASRIRELDWIPAQVVYQRGSSQDRRRSWGFAHCSAGWSPPLVRSLTRSQQRRFLSIPLMPVEQIAGGGLETLPENPVQCPPKRRQGTWRALTAMLRASGLVEANDI
jgi:hypothetical protein